MIIPPFKLGEENPTSDFTTIPDAALTKIILLNEEKRRADTEILRHHVLKMRPIHQKREEIINLPDVKNDFWKRVFSCAPDFINDYIGENDAEILGSCLTNFTVEIFELDEQGNGNPHSLRFIFDFDKEKNNFFDNTQLVKDLYWRKQLRHTNTGKRRIVTGLVSEPNLVKLIAKVYGDSDFATQACEEVDYDDYDDDDDDNRHPDIGGSIESNESPASTSFFSFFGYRGGSLSIEDNAKANEEDDKRYARVLKGEGIDESYFYDADDEVNEEEHFNDIEIFSNGQNFAIILSSGLYSNATDHYVRSFDLVDDSGGSDNFEYHERDEFDYINEDHDDEYNDRYDEAEDYYHSYSE
ncbi:hypothetical protein N7462_011610 [Penicillium macrosclerotiorum]|uniref:uncharacterized protein n=1 Tax=Penicillium macrosclerotiorum TaxID=303699 RepID=UPI002548D53C|nr:uncharacterized protein N7462_011610 [Penicillium macrosclerotiorum]KAJ5662684.1 hypothetical protein N7462_011610 [Penicillium macrosclerotiorum]